MDYLQAHRAAALAAAQERISRELAVKASARQQVKDAAARSARLRDPTPPRLPGRPVIRRGGRAAYESVVSAAKAHGVTRITAFRWLKKGIWLYATPGLLRALESGGWTAVWEWQRTQDRNAVQRKRRERAA